MSTALPLSGTVTWKELFTIVVAVHIWGSLWQRQKILFHCDNQAVVSIWESGSTWAKETMALVRLLYYCAAKYNIYVCTAHMAGAKNNIADCLSRFQQTNSRSWHHKPTPRQTTFVLGQPSPSSMPPAVPPSWSSNLYMLDLPIWA